MNFLFQQQPIAELTNLAAAGRQSIVIEGPSGVGKSYLSRQYANMVGISDFQSVSPKVDDIRESVNTCLTLNTPVVLSIENLDQGVLAASYALLKFLEEPLPNVYIVITCSNMSKVPDTIISRSAVVSVGPPIDKDLDEYGSSVNFERYDSLRNLPIWKCARTFKDVDRILSLTDAQLAYFFTLPDVLKFKDSVSNIVWKIGHFDDNTETPVDLVIRYIMNSTASSYIRMCGVSCIRELEQARIAPHAILSKFIFSIKYFE